MTRITAGTTGMESGGRMAMAGTRADIQRIRKRKARQDQSAGRQTLVEPLTGTSWTVAPATCVHQSDCVVKIVGTSFPVLNPLNCRPCSWLLIR